MGGGFRAAGEAGSTGVAGVIVIILLDFMGYTENPPGKVVRILSSELDRDFIWKGFRAESWKI